jgi:carbonic anhydrase
VFPKQKELFQRLADRQNPQALFITCADSRIVPDLITQSEPGDLFVCRNVGNVVPSYGELLGGVSSAIEYAVEALGVKNIVICGHSNCGAMKALLNPDVMKDMPTVQSWLRNSASAVSVVNATYPTATYEEKLNRLIEQNVVSQLEHLKTHPSVAAGVARGELKLYGWVYEIHTADIIAYDGTEGRFVPLDGSNASATPAPRLTAAVR